MHRDELIARLEQATGPDRELDCLLQLAAAGDLHLAAGEAWGPGYHYRHGDKLSSVKPTPSAAIWFRVPAYTASIDAALTLVPEGWAYALAKDLIAPGCHVGLQRRGPFASAEGSASTPALAIVIAALRAGQEGEGS